MTEFWSAELLGQLRSLGVVAGDVLLVHTSFRAVRPVTGGPEGLIAALLAAVGPSGTLVMPSWSGDDDQPFDARTSPADASLGIVAQTFWQQPGVVRSQHAQAFAAKGPHAAHITADPLPLPPHIPQSPVGRVHELDGKVLLLGVDHDANTTLHLAELLAQVPYRLARYCTVLRNGEPLRVDYLENDHCGARFVMAGKWLKERGWQQEGKVGNAAARLMRSRAVVDTVLPRSQADPLIFLHPAGHPCEECAQARASVAR